MSERLNKTSICSIVFLDIVEYSQKSVSEQIECKDRFNRLINDAIKDVAQNDRIILDTGDGAAIALLGAPEEALFVSLTIRDCILKGNQDRSDALLFVRIGINLGPVRVVRDLNGQLSIIGDGINVAQRVMCFAEPNQILVSRSYYEIVSRLSDEFTQMFTYSGIKQDKHVREHELYIIRPSSEHAPLQGIVNNTPMDADTVDVPRKADPKKLLLVGGALTLLISVLMVRSHISPVEKSPSPASAPALAAGSKETKPAAPVQSPASQAPAAPSTESGAAEESKAHSISSSDVRKTGEHQSAESASADLGSPEKKGNAKPTRHASQEKRAKHATESCTDAERSLNQCH